MSKNFIDFNLSEDILKAIDGLGYKEPSKVQTEVIPEVMLNKDVLVKSQTGSGKTASFAIPLCEKVDWEENTPQVLVLTPTRELAVQIKQDIINIGRFKRVKCVTLFGRQPFKNQTRELKLKTHFVVGTPGRVFDHIEKGTLDLSKIKYLVLDEADEMLNMGFIGQVEKIIKRTPRKRTTMLFSATVPERVHELSKKYMDRPVNIEIEAEKTVTETIEHKLYRVKASEKARVLEEMLLIEKPETVVVFCRTKENVEHTYKKLADKNYSVGKIHGGMLQKERLDAMNKYKRGAFRILVATDVAARGIDIDNITHVINMDIPMEKESYVHRIGRTGRAGKEGKALTFVTPHEDKFLEQIHEYLGFEIEEFELPSIDEVMENKKEGQKVLKSKPKVKVDKAKEINKGIMKIYMNGGKRKKIRPGDIVGAISNVEGVTPEDIGIIDVQDIASYVEILNGKGNDVLYALRKGTIKGKKLKVDRARN